MIVPAAESASSNRPVEVAIRPARDEYAPRPVGAGDPSHLFDLHAELADPELFLLVGLRGEARDETVRGECGPGEDLFAV